MKPSRMAANRNAKYSGKNTIIIRADTSTLDAFLDQLGDSVAAAARPAAQAGAQVLYEEVQGNVRRLGWKTGNLFNAIYQAFSPERSGPGKAEYHIGWRTSGNGIRAPHGHLVEYDHIQRYATYIDRKTGQWKTAVRPSMYGKPPPKSSASRAVKDAYFVLRNGGPQQIAGKRFIRNAVSKFPEAEAAAIRKIMEFLGV